ncbi:reverse transcriptase domain-containing protein [Tanacetum coccineum]|uniref:Reverse transcriptase domain-containing protein n=1 Tax=Tanacetum coccineum TaxID=301880 RepID=A0ABQ5DVR7_9ASTR
MVEHEPMKKFSKKDQIRLDKELAIKLQAEEEEERLAREKVKANVTLIEEWNDIQAKIEADQLLAERLQAREQEKLTIEERANLFQQLLEKRRKHFAAKRAEEKRNRPQQKLNKEKMFDKAFKRVNTFVDFRTEIAQESNSKRVRDELEQESIKKQKVDKDTKTAELQSLMQVIPDEEEVAIDAIPLATKPPTIFNWKIYKEGKNSYYQIIRADGSSKMYRVFSLMLKSFNRQNLEDLFKLVKDKYGSTRLVEDLDLILYGDLKTMFDPHVEDQREAGMAMTTMIQELAERRQAPPTRECTYSDFLKCQPLNFKGTKGFVCLTQWFEKTESVFHISNYTVACQTKFATCTLQGNALTWWNSHIKTVTHEVAYAMTWKTLKKMMTNKYYPKGEIKKLEIEMENLKVKGADMVSYNQRFQELSLMCSRMFLKESNEIEKYVGGLPNMIHGSIRTITERQTKNKRKLDDNSSDNNAQQPPFKRQNVARAYSARPSEKKEYAGTLPLCNKCKLYHNGPCIVKNQGHYRSDCPELKNRNHGNQTGGTEARGMVYALGGGEINQDPNNIENDINA